MLRSGIVILGQGQENVHVKVELLQPRLGPIPHLNRHGVFRHERHVPLGPTEAALQLLGDIGV